MIRLILMSDFTESFAYRFLKGVLNYSKGREPWVVCKMRHSYKRANGIESVLEWASKWGADAIIGLFDADDDVDLFARNGIIAIAQDYKQKFDNIPNITSDYHLTGRMSADYFMEKGFHNFGFYGHKDVCWSDERCDGFKARLAECGKDGPFYEYYDDNTDYLWSYEDGSFTDWICSLPPATAIMCCDDTMGNRLMDVARLCGRRVPEDLAVLGVDDDETICNLSDPPMSSVKLNIEKAGHEAAMLIEKLLADPAVEAHDIIIQPITVINRLSTDIYPTADENLLKALRFIHQNISCSINVNDVLSKVPMSRRLLETRFKAATGKTLYRYILDLKMEHLANLLLSGNTPVGDLAIQLGFADEKNVSRLFRSYSGLTPLEYRKKNRC